MLQLVLEQFLELGSLCFALGLGLVVLLVLRDRPWAHPLCVEVLVDKVYYLVLILVESFDVVVKF